MEFFETLGSLVSGRWKERNYDEAAFPDVASRSLAELPPAQYISMWDVVRWSTTVDKLPRQDDIEAAFGDPPLTVYTGRGFRIEVLFWMKGIPAIHQHSFSGAFHVMQGSSIHSVWDFEAEEQIGVRLQLGRASFKRSEILEMGDSRPILAGNQMFHATYHLDRPSISVVVRTIRETDRQPQYSVRPPTIAFAALDEIATVKRQKQILSMLLAADKRAEFAEICRHLVGTKDGYSIFEFLRSVFSSIEDEEERQNLKLLARLKHPRLVDALWPALLEEEIGEKILKLHRAVDDAELKFFLALLRNVPQRKTILQLIEHRFPGRDPAATLTGWVRKLSGQESAHIQFEESWLLMLECLLRNRSARETIAAFTERYGPERVPSAAALHQLCSALKSSWLLRSLCPSSPFEVNEVVPLVDTVSPSHPEDARSAHTVLSANDPCSNEPQVAATNGWRAAVAMYKCLLDAQPDSLVPRARQTKNGHGRSTTWTVNPSLRFSAAGRCPDPSIQFADAVATHEPTVWVSDPVTAVVNPFVLGPTSLQVVSTLRPGGELTEEVPAELLSTIVGAGLVYDAEACEARQKEWRESLLNARARFQEGYAVLGSLLHPYTLGAARAHFRQLIQQGKPRYGDKQTARRWNEHNEPVARFLHHQLAPIVEEIAGRAIKPSYVYFASYHQGAKLPRHVDRAQCEVSLSMLIDYSPEPDEESPWPLWLDTKSGSVAVHQRLGDTLIYRGRELPHYRHELPSGHTSTHLFFHYVPADFTGSLD